MNYELSEKANKKGQMQRRVRPALAGQDRTTARQKNARCDGEISMRKSSHVCVFYGMAFLNRSLLKTIFNIINAPSTPLFTANFTYTLTRGFGVLGFWGFRVLEF